jgi:hypothetical protein
MPYILQKRRDSLDPTINALLDELEKINAGAGDYNYVITSLLLGFIDFHGTRYEHFNTVHGILDCVGREFYRRFTAPYEDQAMIRNGDVLIPRD